MTQTLRDADLVANVVDDEVKAGVLMHLDRLALAIDAADQPVRARHCEVTGDGSAPK